MIDDPDIGGRAFGIAFDDQFACRRVIAAQYGIDAELAAGLACIVAANGEGAEFIVIAARSQPAGVDYVTGYSAGALQKGIMQDVDRAGKVFTAAAVYLQGAAVHFDGSGKAVVVIGRSQHTGAGLNKSAAGIDAVQHACNGHVISVGVDDCRFVSCRRGQVDLFVERHGGFRNQAAVIDGQIAVCAQSVLRGDRQAAAVDDSDAAVGVGAGIRPQRHDAAACFYHRAAADDLPLIAAIIVLFKNERAAVGQVDIPHVAVDRMIDRQAFGFGA